MPAHGVGALPAGYCAPNQLQHYAIRAADPPPPCAAAAPFVVVGDPETNRVAGWIVDGERHGIWREFHLTGPLASETKYDHGKRVGVALSCYRDGFPKAVRHFAQGQEHGLRLIWYRDGTHWQEQYVDGIRHGPWRAFVDGVLREEGTYKNNAKHGEWREWDGRGRPLRSTKWRAGEVS